MQHLAPDTFAVSISPFFAGRSQQGRAARRSRRFEVRTGHTTATLLRSDRIPTTSTRPRRRPNTYPSIQRADLHRITKGPFPGRRATFSIMSQSAARQLALMASRRVTAQCCRGAARSWTAASSRVAQFSLASRTTATSQTIASQWSSERTMSSSRRSQPGRGTLKRYVLKSHTPLHWALTRLYAAGAGPSPTRTSP